MRPTVPIAAMLVLVVGSLLSLSAAADEKRPNILLILSDDHSTPHLGCYDNPDVKTPVLDRLAADGMLFDRAYVTAPQCAPSRASILTGRTPIDVEMTRFSVNLKREYKMLPEYLDALGYFTGLAGRSHHLDSGTNPKHGVAELLTADQQTSIHERVDFCRVVTGKDKHAGFRDRCVQQFKDFLDTKPADAPFFVQLCWSDPHRGFDRKNIPDPVDPKTLKLPPFYPDTPGVRRDLADYYNEINRLDFDTGRVLKILEERGFAKNTIVIFMGDNGAAQFRGKGTLNEFGIRVPFVIRWPGVIKPGGRTGTLISGEDITPTLMQAVGLEVPDEITGASFLPLLKGESFEEREYVFAERGPHAAALPRGSARFDLGRVVVGKRYKLIFNALWQLPYQPVDFDGAKFFRDLAKQAKAGELAEPFNSLYFAPQRPMFELYDLQSDPWEMKNLFGQEGTQAIEDELRRQLSAWQMRQHDFVPIPYPRKKDW